MGATSYLSGVSGHDYLDESIFAEAGIPIRYQAFHHTVYPQCYKPFLPMMSSLDLLFNTGPVALQMLADANIVQVWADAL